MNRFSKFHGRRGFTLAEILVGVVCLGLVLVPFMSFVAKIPDLNAAIGQHARREGARSWQDSVMAEGINPAAASVYNREINAAVPGVALSAILIEHSQSVAGIAKVAALTTTDGEQGGASSIRVNGAGFELGVGVAVANPTLPVAPLQPIAMLTPNVAPVNGSVVPVGSFTSVAPGQPYRRMVTASVADAGRVTLIMNSPSVTVAGVGTAGASASTTDFASGVSGRSWNEYAGNLGAGDFSVSLGDGRQQWYVAVGEQWQPYDPSPFVNFSYLLGLGQPVLVDYNGIEVAAGGNVAVDYAHFLGVQSGAMAMGLDWPAATKQAFGSSFGSLGIGFNWTFQAVAGPYSGDMGSFFSPGNLTLWTALSTVQAAPVVPATVVASGGTWTVQRVATVLGMPDMTSASVLAGGTFEAGDINLAAPIFVSTRIGRVSASSGGGSEVVSTNETLAIGITPP